MIEFLQNAGAIIFFLGIFCIAYGLYCMNHRPLGEATKDDLEGAKMYPIGIGMLFLGMILVGKP